MKILREQINKRKILVEYNTFFQTMIKAVVDVENEIIAIDAELHADLETYLLGEGSTQENLWGINLYLEKERKDWIEYTALINIRPSVGNRWMEIKDPKIKKKIEEIIEKLIRE
jgi:hypothetical protein